MDTDQEGIEIKKIRGTTLKSFFLKHGLKLIIEEQLPIVGTTVRYRGHIKGAKLSRYKHLKARPIGVAGETPEDCVRWAWWKLHGGYVEFPDGEIIGPLKLNGSGY